MKRKIKQITLSETHAAVLEVSFQILINEAISDLAKNHPNPPKIEIITDFGDSLQGMTSCNASVDDFIHTLEKDETVDDVDIIFTSDGNGKFYYFFVINPVPEITFQFTSDNSYIKVCIIYRQNKE